MKTGGGNSSEIRDGRKIKLDHQYGRQPHPGLKGQRGEQQTSPLSGSAVTRTFIHLHGDIAGDDADTVGCNDSHAAIELVRHLVDVQDISPAVYCHLVPVAMVDLASADEPADGRPRVARDIDADCDGTRELGENGMLEARCVDSWR